MQAYSRIELYYRCNDCQVAWSVPNDKPSGGRLPQSECWNCGKTCGSTPRIMVP